MCSKVVRNEHFLARIVAVLIRIVVVRAQMVDLARIVVDLEFDPSSWPVVEPLEFYQRPS